MRNMIIALLALVIGGAGGYYYAQQDVKVLTAQVETIGKELAEARQKAQSEVDALTAAKNVAEDAAKAAQSELTAAREAVGVQEAKVTDLLSRIPALESELAAARQASQSGN